jgi:hypothetical protein
METRRAIKKMNEETREKGSASSRSTNRMMLDEDGLSEVGAVLLVRPGLVDLSRCVSNHQPSTINPTPSRIDTMSD